MQPNSAQEKRILPVIYTVSIVIPLAVAVLMVLPDSMKESLGWSTSANVRYLPQFHALPNGLTFLFLVAAGVAIKAKRIAIHKSFVLAAFTLSSLFLISYVIYHLTTPSARFGGTGWVRPLYFFILISHILLSVPVIPLALLSIYRGWTNNIEKHKKIVRWSFPIWLYVSLTGVLVYFFMQSYY